MQRAGWRRRWRRAQPAPRRAALRGARPHVRALQAMLEVWQRPRGLRLAARGTHLCHPPQGPRRVLTKSLEAW